MKTLYDITRLLASIALVTSVSSEQVLEEQIDKLVLDGEDQEDNEVASKHQKQPEFTSEVELNIELPVSHLADYYKFLCDDTDDGATDS